MELAFPGLPSRPGGYRRRYLEVRDGVSGEAPGIEFTAAEVDHVPALQCYGFRAHVAGRTLMYSGDAKLCPGLLKLAAGSEILVLDCSCGGDSVHLTQAEVDHVRRKAPRGAATIVTHLDDTPSPGVLTDTLVAEDLHRFQL
jgi:ribonuclease BN (tRNA processing enzyme)